MTITNGLEAKDGLEIADYPYDFRLIRTGITREARQPTLSSGLKSKNWTVSVIDGFEDLIGESVGEGVFYNHSGSTWQLIMALSVSTNPRVIEIVEERRGNSRAIAERLRQEQVLAGQRLIDLGSGVIPSFALAAKSMGATAFTADLQQPARETVAKLDGHIKVNLNRKSAAEEIMKAAGGDFDLVSENIVGLVPFQDHNAVEPEPETLRAVAIPLLKSGGYYYSVGSDLFRKTKNP